MAEAHSFGSVDALPDDARALFAGAPFQSRPEWWRSVEAAALPAGAAPHFVLCREAGRPVALLPLLADAGGRLSSLGTPYTVCWQPLVATDADAAGLARAGRALGRWCARWPLLRLDALDPAWPGLRPLLSGLRRAGYLAGRFDHFGNWSEAVAGVGWAAYLAARPGALRETVRRKQARVERDPSLRLDCASTPGDVEPAIAAYLGVYRRSWKVAEPFPDFDASLLRAAAGAGALRLGTLTREGETIAAQYWIVREGSAMVLKLAHDEAHRALSPGTVLTAWMIRRLIETEAVRMLDFGRGDDPYKQLWTTCRRQRIGLLLARPWRPRGAAALARQWAGATARAIGAGPRTP